MQETFRKMTATAILRTATVETMADGNVEIVVTSPERAFVMLLENNTMRLHFRDRNDVTLPLSAPSLATLEALLETQAVHQEAVNNAA